MANGSPPLPPPRARSEVFPVFVDSSLDTHLAMVVSSADTIADLKRYIAVEHSLCFPNNGEITVLSLKVRRRGAFYHLSDSMLVRSAFEGIKGTWFLHADVVATSKMKCEAVKEDKFLNRNGGLEGADELHVDPSSRVLLGCNEDNKQALVENRPILDEQDISQNDAPDVQHIKSKTDITNGQSVNKIQPQESESLAIEVAMTSSKINQAMEKGGRQEECGISKFGANEMHASAGGKKNENPRKKVKASKNDQIMDGNSEHISIEKKREDKERAFEVPVKDHTAEHDKEGPLLQNDARKLQNVLMHDATMVKEKDTEQLQSKLADDNSKSLPSLANDRGKKRKKRQSSKSQNEVDVPSKKCNTGFSQNKQELCGDSHKKAETVSPSEGKGAEGKLEEVINKQKNPTKEPKTVAKIAIHNMANGSSMKVESAITQIKKFDVSNINHGNSAKISMSTNRSDGNLPIQLAQADDNESDLHKLKSRKSDAAASNKEVVSSINGAEAGLEGQNNPVHVKKRSRSASSKKSSGNPAPFNFSESMCEDYTEEAAQNKNRHIVKELVADKINSEAAIVKSSAKLGSDILLDANFRSSHDKKKKDHKKTEFTNVHSDFLEISRSLGGRVNEKNYKEMLDDKELRGKDLLGESVAIKSTASVDSGAQMNIKGKSSQRKRKQSIKSELQYQESDVQQESTQHHVKEIAERKQRVPTNLSHNDLDKESNPAANFGADVPGGTPEKPDLTTDPSTKSTSSHRQKKKVVKVVPLSGITDDHEPILTSDNQATGKNSEKSSRTTNENSWSNAVQDINKHETTSMKPEHGNQDINKDLMNTQTTIAKNNVQSTAHKIPAGSLEANEGSVLAKSDNDKVDSLNVFVPKAVQHHNDVSAPNLPALEIESGRQHKDKNKRKRKSSIHPQDSPLDLVNPSIKKEKHVMELNPTDVDHGNLLNGYPKTKEIGIHTDQNLPNSAAGASMKEVFADRAASSNSMEETPIQTKRYRVAARKAPKRSLGEVFKSSKEEKIAFAPSGTISSDATSGSSDDESDISNRETTRRLVSDSSYTSTDSDGDLEDAAGSGSSNFAGKDERVNDGDVMLSQTSTVSKRSIPLGTILRSTSSYKKAKLLASQSQAEDSEIQPVETVLETQPDTY